MIKYLVAVGLALGVVLAAPIAGNSMMQFKHHSHQGHHQRYAASVTIYYASYCGACHDLMNKLDSLGIRYNAVDIENGNYPNIQEIPVLVVNGHSYVGDMSMGQLEAVLGR